MNREQALEVVAKLALGLGPDQAGCERLLERVANDPEAEMLRAVLVELGAATLLDQATPSTRNGCANVSVVGKDARC